MMTIKPTLFQQLVLAWFKKYGRKHLPWQKDITPYKVWLSEIMLQQTQVKTVIPYFKKFIKQFPDVNTLAAADINTVLHLWTGLGYYARARNLHLCAKIIVEKYKGLFPTSINELETLPGIGRSTAGAILSLSMQKRAPILDGNVKRVLTRVFCLEGYPGHSQIQKILWNIAEKYTPKKNVAAYTQVMMDLGAMICTRTKPKCNACPLKPHCQAHKENRATEFPNKKPKKVLPIKSIYMLILKNKNQELLLTQRPPTGIWGGLWSFPECNDEKDIKRTLAKQFGFQIVTKRELHSFRHTFSHYHLDITPILIEATLTTKQMMETEPVIWYNKQKLGLPQPVKKLLQQIKELP